MDALLKEYRQHAKENTCGHRVRAKAIATLQLLAPSRPRMSEHGSSREVHGLAHSADDENRRTVGRV